MTYRSTINVTVPAARINSAAGDAVRLAVEHLLTEANKTVPHDEGTLERSGSASVEGTTGAVSYDTPYAVKQHEDMTLHHDGKGKAKWLESTMTMEAGTIGELMARAIEREAGT